jgi:sulfur relay (sulfurtransferase) complex TusBCD TusD component (DsrE family)
MVDRCSFCGSTAGPFSNVEELFTVLMCADCQAARGYSSGPYPVMTRAELRAGLDLMATWALAQKAAATRQVIDIMRQHTGT